MIEELEAFKGDTIVIPVTVGQSSRLPVDVTDATFNFDAKVSLADTNPLLTKTSDEDGGITVTDAEAGQIEVTLVPDDTIELTMSDAQTLLLYWAVRMTIEDVVTTVATGTLRLKQMCGAPPDDEDE